MRALVRIVSWLYVVAIFGFIFLPVVV
ncbi:MAG: ABC transporter permease, partial [Mesorhizobium sp.]